MEFSKDELDILYNALATENDAKIELLRQANNKGHELGFIPSCALEKMAELINICLVEFDLLKRFTEAWDNEEEASGQLELIKEKRQMVSRIAVAVGKSIESEPIASAPEV